MPTVHSHPQFPYDRARKVLSAVLRRMGSPAQRALAFVATEFGAALVTTLAVCARAGASDDMLQQMAIQQIHRHAHVRN